MSHRGRLNVLANILGKSYEKIFREFEGNLDPRSREGTGDVKYHLGATGTFTGPAGATLHITLASNPSHLEAVDPVVEGMARALQDTRGDAAREQVLPVLVHGDAAFAGQGVVAETLNMSALSGYRTGGTIHVVVNNGIGFTTSPADARSSVYATDVAKMVQAPIFHVNGEDPEACVHVMDLALAFRREFKKDVVVDMVGYRRWGHNEADEPAYTQPIMYARIRDRRSVRKLYTERLVNRGDMSLEEAEGALKDFQERLEAAFAATHESAPPSAPAPHGAPAAVRRRDAAAPRLAGLARAGPAARHHASGGVPRPPQTRAPAHSAAPDARAGRRGLGHRGAARVRLVAPGGHTGAPLGAGFPARHVLPASRGAGGPGHGQRAHTRSSTSPPNRPLSSSTTACCPSTRCWGSSTATRSPATTRW